MSTKNINNEAIKGQKNSLHIDNSERRSFLKKTIGLGTVAMMGSVNSNAELLDLSNNINSNNENRYINNDMDMNDSWSKYVKCIDARIPTRLFSSSNACTAHDRNQLAVKRMTCAGFRIQNPQVMDRRYYRFGGSDYQRAKDFQDIAEGKVVAPKLLLGSRGGYGAMRILDKVNWSKVASAMREHETIVGGFSDVTAIQCALLVQGMGSFNLPMAYSEFGKYTPDPISCSGFVKAITDKNLSLHVYDSSRTDDNLPVIIGPNKNISGIIWGGNLSVLSSLSGSQFLPKPKGGVVFIEEVGEQPYKLERMLYNLYLSGAFDNQQAIVFGAMARSGKDGYDPHYDVAVVIKELQHLTGLTIYNGVGFGHVSKKQSFPMGCQCDLIPSNQGFELKFSGYPTIDRSLINQDALSMEF